MLKSILVPFDGSVYGHSQTAFGINLAKKTGSRLEGLFFRSEGMEIPAKDAEDRFKNLCEENQLQYIVHRADNEIPELAIRNHSTACDLVLLGLKSYFKDIEKVRPCDTFEKVTKESFRPLVLFPEKIFPPSFDEAVIVTDGSAESWKSIQLFTLLGMAKLYTKVTIVSAMSRLVDAERITFQVSRYLKNHSVNSLEKSIETNSSPWKPVIGYLESASPSLLIMGVYGTGGIKEILLGSFTTSLIQKSSVPIFTCR